MAKKRRKTKDQKEQEAWELKRRPAGHFALHVPRDAYIKGTNEWRPDADVNWRDDEGELERLRK